MAKSLRAKAKMANRRKKREGGNYHAADAARVARISAKLLGKEKKVDGEGEEDDEEMVEDEEDAKDGEDADMAGETKPAKISTSGPRSSRREEWRKSKGMEARPKRLGQNKVGVAGARHKSGRPKRRR